MPHLAKFQTENQYWPNLWSTKKLQSVQLQMQHGSSKQNSLFLCKRKKYIDILTLFMCIVTFKCKTLLNSLAPLIKETRSIWPVRRPSWLTVCEPSSHNYTVADDPLPVLWLGHHVWLVNECRCPQGCFSNTFIVRRSLSKHRIIPKLAPWQMSHICTASIPMMSAAPFKGGWWQLYSTHARCLGETLKPPLAPILL